MIGQFLKAYGAFIYKYQTAEAATNQQGDFYNDKKYFYTTRPANWLLLPLLDACT